MIFSIKIHRLFLKIQRKTNSLGRIVTFHRYIVSISFFFSRWTVSSEEINWLCQKWHRRIEHRAAGRLVKAGETAPFIMAGNK